MAQIPLSNGGFALVDDADLHLVQAFRWRAVKGGHAFYAQANIKNAAGKKSSVHMQRVILGDEARGLVVDHINRDGLDNRRSNLRACTHAQNLCNQIGGFASKPGRLKGAHWHKRKQQWASEVALGAIRKHLGYFKTQEEAHAAYCEAARELHGEFARGAA